MKGLKRIILFTLAAALVVSVLSVSVFAADGASALVVTADKTELKPGDEVTFTVSLKNDPGIWAVKFDLVLDSEVFEFESFSKTGCLDLPNGISGYVEKEGVFRFNGATTDYFNDMTDDGKLVSVTYKAKEAAKVGSYSVKAVVDAKNTINTNGTPVAIADGTVSVSIANVSADTTTSASADTTAPAPADTTTPDTEGGKGESDPPQTGDFGAAILPVVVAVSVLGIGITAVSVKSREGRK